MKRIVSVILVLGLSFSAQIVQAQWNPSKRLTWNAGNSMNPAMAIDSANTIHVVWDDHTPGTSEIYCQRSTDGGATWGGTKRLTWNAGTSTSSAIAIDSVNTIHVVWQDDTLGKYEIYYRNGKY